MNTKRIAVAMSGGVDSSVAAALLKEQGQDVEGVTMRVLPDWMDSTGDEVAKDDARHACAQLDIAHHIADLRGAFEKEVLRQFARDYRRAQTPNPCIVCNERVKFGALWQWARTSGFDALATGHYAATDGAHLMRPRDRVKDQTYFMYRIPRRRLSSIAFPLQDLDKTQVRDYARENGLVCAGSEESQDACFIANSRRRDIIERIEPGAYQTGEIVTSDGAVVGTHQGLAEYTVGQRHGLGIGGQAEPLYVVALDCVRNQVIVGSRMQAIANTMTCEDIVLDESVLESTSGSWPVMAKARHNMAAAPARLELGDARMTVVFEEALCGISPGQSVVCYQGDTLVAGGIIACAH